MGVGQKYRVDTMLSYTVFSKELSRNERNAQDRKRHNFIQKYNEIRTSHFQSKWLYNKMIEIYWEYVIKFNSMQYQWSGGRPLSLFFATRQASEPLFNEHAVFFVGNVCKS